MNSVGKDLKAGSCSLRKRLRDLVIVRMKPEFNPQRQGVTDSGLLSIWYSERMRFGVQDELVQTYLIRIGEDEVEILQRFG